MLPKQIQNKQILSQLKPQQLPTAKVNFAGCIHAACSFSQQQIQGFVLLGIRSANAFNNIYDTQ